MVAFIPAAVPFFERHALSRPRRGQRISVTPRANLSNEASSDWRAFRARLIQTENEQSASQPGGIGEWAHPVPFVEAGSLLIASPEHFVGEHSCSFFANSVVLVLSHGGGDGTVGVILNRPISASVSDLKLRDSASKHDTPLYLGGPVGLDSLLVIHADNSVPSSVEIVRGVVTSGAREVVQRIEDGKMKANDCRFFCGYSGWSPGQLQEEIDEGVWYTCASCVELMMAHRVDPDESLVKKLLHLMGGRYTEIGERLDDKETGRSFEF